MKSILRIFLVTTLLMLFSSGIAEEMRVIFLDVGKADAILITTGDHTILIDSATDKKGDDVVEAIENAGCSQIDLFIVTHFDKDHVGGADTVLESVPVKQVFIPSYLSDSKQYKQFMKALEETDTDWTALSENIQINIGDMHFYIDVANEDDYGDDEENDFSLVTSLTYGDTSWLFAGDAENPRLKELLEEGIGHHDVLKVPHHGRYEKRTRSFFEAVSPRFAVITSDSKNLEEAAVLDALKAVDASIYLTREGTVIMTTDGKEIIVSQ